MEVPQEHLAVGNAILIDDDDDFEDGYYSGTSYYYDRNNQLPQPLTSSTVRAFLIENMNDPRETPAWNAGFILGWVESLCENNPKQFFTSILVKSDGCSSVAIGQAS